MLFELLQAAEDAIGSTILFFYVLAGLLLTVLAFMAAFSWAVRYSVRRIRRYFIEELTSSSGLTVFGHDTARECFRRHKREILDR